MTLYPKLIMDALAKVRYPGTGKDLVTMGMVEDNIRIDGNKVSFSLLFEKPNDPFIKSVVKAAETAILTYVGEEVEIKGNITVEAKQAARPEPDKLLPEVKNIIAVSSGKIYHRVNLSHFPLELGLRYVEQLPFGFLQEIVDVVALVESLCLDCGGVGYKASCKIFLSDYSGVIFHVGCGIYAGGEFGDVYRAAYFFEGAVLTQLFGDGHHVDGALIETQGRYCLENLLVNRVVETVGHKNVAYVHVGIFLKHACAEHHLFKIGVARR